jgi:hypothetical protein
MTPFNDPPPFQQLIAAGVVKFSDKLFYWMNFETGVYIFFALSSCMGCFYKFHAKKPDHT